jgi:hypothetical protein
MSALPHPFHRPQPPNPFNQSYFPPISEPEPEQGYLPPDPAFYDYYGTDPALQAFAQSQQKPHFTFMRRINKMNWDFLGNIDVGAIARTGDVNSVEYLLHPIAFANITKEDAPLFGSRASLHAFLLLQMAVEVLLSKLANVPASAVAPPAPIQPHPHQIAQFEAKVELLNRDVKSRDSIITSLTDRLRIAEQGRDEAYASIQALQAKKMPAVAVESQSKEVRKGKTVSEMTEAGMDHIDTEYLDYLQNRPQKRVVERKKKKSGRGSGKRESRESGSERDWESSSWT